MKRTHRSKKGKQRKEIKQNRPNWRKKVIGKTEQSKIKLKRKTIFRKSKKIKGKEWEKIK